MILEESEVNLIRQAAEAAARTKMFVRGTRLEHYYATLDSQLRNLADKIERQIWKGKLSE